MLVLNQESASDLSSCGKEVTHSKPWLSLFKKWPEAFLSRGFSGLFFFLEEDCEHGSYLDLLSNAAKGKKQMTRELCSSVITKIYL